MSTILTAHNQYANRPKDEQFPNFAALLMAATDDKNLSAERMYNLRDLAAVPSDGGVKLQSPNGTATMTHWSFGQLARTLGAPAGYLRSLTPTLAADCLNYGIQQAPVGTRANILARAANGNPEPIIRACTSESYGRAWDADLLDLAQRHVFSMPSATRGQWQNAPTWAGEEIAGFRGDRDSFVLQIDGGSIVTDPSAGKDGQMYRAVMLRNSETGAAGVTIETVLFRYICGNWMLWGAVLGSSFRRRHVGSNVVRDVVRELATVARRFCDRPASQDEALIQTLINREIAHDRAAVVDELRAMGATKEQAEGAFDRCVQQENVSPRSFWGIAQGLTRMSQDDGYQDERYAIDKLAAVVLARGARVAA
jgi:hypothetical protein